MLANTCCWGGGDVSPCGSIVTRNEAFSKNQIKNESLLGAMPQALVLNPRPRICLSWHAEPWVWEQALLWPLVCLCSLPPEQGRCLTNCINDKIQ